MVSADRLNGVYIQNRFNLCKVSDYLYKVSDYDILTQTSCTAQSTFSLMFFNLLCF